MKRSHAVCRAAGTAGLLLLATRCSSVDRAEVRNLAACSVVSVDTTGWVRRPGPYHGFSYLVPPTFKEDTSGLFIHGGTMWRDGARAFSQSNGYWSPASFRGNYAAEPPAELEYSECWMTVAGLRVLIATRHQAGVYAAHAYFPDPRATPGLRGYETVLGGHGMNRQDQQLLLAIFRTIAPDSSLVPGR
ncbi:MAG TPA: hypothetical protein VF006_25755 [Longimicrobium sp.]